MLFILSALCDVPYLVFDFHSYLFKFTSNHVHAENIFVLKYRDL